MEKKHPQKKAKKSTGRCMCKTAHAKKNVRKAK